MTEQEALEMSATAWCGEKTRNKVVDPELALEFARILKRECDKAAQRQEGISVPEAMTVLRGAMKADPDYAYSWHCNISCAAMDCGMGYEAANRAAARFMSWAFYVDTSYSPQPKKPESNEDEPEPTWRDRPALL